MGLQGPPFKALHGRLLRGAHLTVLHLGCVSSPLTHTSPLPTTLSFNSSSLSVLPPPHWAVLGAGRTSVSLLNPPGRGPAAGTRQS